MLPRISRGGKCGIYLFAATPPLEGLKVILGALAMEAHKGHKLLVADISRAFFYAPATREVYVDLPEEDTGPGEVGLCGRLCYSLYGTRDAAQNWQSHVTKTMNGLGFISGKSSPCMFYNPEWGLRSFVHGDDFVTTGSPEALRWFGTVLKKVFALTSILLGPDATDSKKVKILNRLVTWVDGVGIQYEADPQHAQTLIREILGHDDKGIKTAVTPGVKGQEDSEKEIIKHIAELKRDSTKMDKEEATSERKEEIHSYRSLAATANFMALDRADIQYSVKEVARKACDPESGDWDKLKRLALYLKGCPRAVTHFNFVAAEDFEASSAELDIYTDSDWAGCRRTRRSTTGGCALWGGMLVKSWSTTQTLVALSSGEAELYALVKASAEGLGLQSLLADIGFKVVVRVKADASAALGVVERRGLGRLRHVHTNCLWVQGCAANKSVKYMKEKGADNPADMFTKNVTRELINKFCKKIGVELRADENEEGYKLGAMELVSEDIARAAGDASLEPWIRMDLKSCCLRGTRPEGPSTASVVQRRTYRKDDGQLLHIDEMEDMKTGFEPFLRHRRFSKPLDTITALLYDGSM